MKLSQEQIRESISEMIGASKEGRKADWFDVMELIGQQQQEIERLEKALKEIERWDRMLYSQREMGNFAKEALGLPTVPLKDTTL